MLASYWCKLRSEEIGWFVTLTMSELDGGGSQLGHPWTSSRGEKCLGTLDGAVPHFILTSSSVPMNCTAVEGVMAALHDCCWTTQPWEKVPDRWSRLTSSRR